MSILSNFSKIFERVIYNRLYSYQTSNDLLYSKKFGFQKRCSTEHAEKFGVFIRLDLTGRKDTAR